MLLSFRRHGTSFSYSSSDGDAASDWGRGCARGNGHSRSTNILVDDDGDWKSRIREGGCALDVDIRGDVAFNADETAIARIARDGRMRVYVRRGDREREMVVTAGADGRPVVVWEVDGERRPWDDAARGWFAQLVPELFRLTGIDAEGRVGRLLARGGVDAVLAEVGRIDSDTVAAKYLRELLRQADPTPEQVGRIVTVAVRGIDSDHELSNLLLSAIELRGAEAVVSAAFLDACDAIDSDHDARRVLSEIVRRGQQPAAVDRALGCLRGVDSDHDTAEVLVLVPPRWPVGQPLPASFYTAARGVGSDHDRRRSLEAATARRPLPAGDVRNVLALAGAFGSDHDLAGVLVSVAAATRLEGELASAFVAAADRIGSDHDRARAMEALARSSHGLR